MGSIQIEMLRDEELIPLILEDQNFFVFLVKRYKAKLLFYIMRLTNVSQEDAEDLLQDVFLKVYLNINSFDCNQKFSSWIYSITHNIVISHHRKKSVWLEKNSFNLDQEAVHKLMSEVDLAKELDIKYSKTNVYSVLNKIKSKFKEILILKFFEEKNYQEISDIIKKPVGTVGSMMNKAKQEFKKELIKQNLKF